MLHKVWILLVIIIFLSCQNESDILIPSLEQYELQDPNLQLEIVASEPLLEAPIALDIDAKGRLWVLEMPDYMPDIDGTNEDIPRGRIVILEDDDNDGVMDEAKVFLDSLHQPRAIRLIYDGLLYAESPNLWFVSIENDQPGEHVLVDSMYAVGGNVEHQPNGLLVNIDNWIYNAKSKKRYRRIQSEWVVEPTAFRGQWGITHDQWGRLYYNDNSNGLFADFLLPNTVTCGKYFESYTGLQQNILSDRSIYPAHPTAINRGYIDGMLDSNLIVQKMTSTCGPLLYNAQQLGESYKHNGFICVPEGNLVKRVAISHTDETITATNWYDGEEWLRSTDEGFRPVNLYHGLEGALYIVDFHRGVIQHKTYMTDYLRKLIIDKGLDSIYGYGRILKISNKKKEEHYPVTFYNITPESLIGFLDHSNMLIRKKAQQYIIQNGNQSTIDSLITFLNHTNEIGKLHSLYALEGLGHFNKIDFENTVSANHPWYNSHLLVIIANSEQADFHSSLSSLINKIESYNHPVSDLYCLFALGKISRNYLRNKFEIINSILNRYPENLLYTQMLIAGHESSFEDLYSGKSNIANPLFHIEFEKYQERKVLQKLNELYAPVQPEDQDDKTRGRRLFGELCSACHGQSGQGIPNLAPGFENALLVNNGPEYIALSILNGVGGPITINGKEIIYPAAMPGLSENQSISDQDIADLANYISNSFVTPPENITVNEIAKLRNVAFKMNTPSTESEIIDLLITIDLSNQ